MRELVTEHFALTPQAAARQKQLGELVAASLHEFLGRREVTAGILNAALLSAFRKTTIPDDPWNVNSYVEFICKKVLPHSINVSSPRCIGHMTGVVPWFVRPLSDFIIALNQNLVKGEASRMIGLMERQTLAMLHRLTYDFPEPFYKRHIHRNGSTLGIMASGGTLANITALWCARNSCFPQDGNFRGVEAEGLAAGLRHYGFERAVIVGSALMHYSIEKAASVLGIGLDNTVKVDVDNRARIDVRALQDVLKDCARRRWRVIAIVGIAGTTDSGSIDSLDRIGRIAEREGIHFHVDAAWGGPLLVSMRHHHKLKGIERASSVTIDAHKQFSVPIGVSALLLRDPRAAKVLEKHAHYMLHQESDDLGKYSIEGSRPGTALLFHAALHLMGRRGYEYLIDERIRMARVLARMIHQSPEFELLCWPDTSIVLYRHIPKRWRSAVVAGKLTRDDNERLNAINETIQRLQYDGGRSFVARTKLAHLSRYRGLPVVALRAIIHNPLTTTQELKDILAEQREHARLSEAVVAQAS